MERVSLGLISLAAGCLAALVAYMIWDALVTETFSLRKDSWRCTASHDETYMTMMLVGKVQVPQFHTQTVCDRWERVR